MSNFSSTPTNYSSPNCNGTISINPTGGTPPYNISWSSGTTNNLCQGWYTATITDANNCVMTDSAYVDFVSGMSEPNAVGFSIYPNPVNDVLFIKSENREISEVKIYDGTGKILLKKIIEDRKGEIDLKTLEVGIYSVEVHNLRVKVVKY